MGFWGFGVLGVHSEGGGVSAVDALGCIIRDQMRHTVHTNIRPGEITLQAIQTEDLQAIQTEDIRAITDIRPDEIRHTNRRCAAPASLAVNIDRTTLRDHLI